MKRTLACLVLALSAAGLGLGYALAQPAAPAPNELGASLFKQRCASCHEPAVDRAPSRQQMAQRWPDEIFRAMKTGVMQPMAAGLSDSEMSAIAEHVAGGRPNTSRPPVQVDPPKCPASTFNPEGRNWNGWGVDHTNHRFQQNGGLAATDIPKLKVKWAFTYIGARYSQPAVVGGRLFMTSGSGVVYAFDARTGCHHWRFDAPTGVRTTVLVSPLPGVAESGHAAFFGDYARNYYAVDAGTGRLLWKTNVETHPRGVLSGSPVMHEGKLIVPISSWEEVTSGAAPYECCTARGAIASLDARTGRVLWKTPMIEQPARPTRRNAAGTQLFGPAGAAVWSTPTIDPKRRLIYAATGNSYTEVPETSSNAIIALDFDTGAIRWKNQVTPGDNYLVGCYGPNPAINCPLGEAGPDYDFGAAPLLITLPSGRDILVAGQKSGTVYGMDPDDAGKVLWRNKVGAGGALGGIEFGMATDGKTVFVANADTFGDAAARKPGIFALDPADGRQLWFTPAPVVPCGWTGGTRCINANSAAPIVIPGAVIAGTTDGNLRAYDPATGRITWTFDTAGQTYQTINGVTDQGGGTIDAGGAVVAEGMVFLMSGYVANMGGHPNNVLLALSPDGR